MNFPRKVFILSCALVLLAFAGRAAAATFTVNTTDDSLGAGGGVVSLRDAATAANAAGGTNTINFDATVFAAAHGPYTIQLTAALPDPTGTLVITGPGAKVLTIQGPGTFTDRLFAVAAGQTVTLSGLTFTGFTLSGTAGANGVNAGTPPTAGGVGMGGVIKNSGALTLSQCVFANNSISGGAGGMGAKGVAQDGATGANGLGGAIYHNGTSLTIDRCTFSQNSARGGVGGEGAFINDNGSGGSGNGAVAGNGQGGALYLAGSNQTITTSTFAGNTAAGGTGGAGGIPNFNGSENAGGAGGWGQGGAIYNSQTVTIKSCTIGLNAANPGDGGSQNNFSTNAAEGSGFGSGIFAPAVVTIGNTIVAGNTTTDAKTLVQTATDVAGVYVSEGFNLIGVNDTASGLVNGATGDKVGSVASPIDAKLDPAGAQYNGGSMPTLRLRKGSPAVDGGTDVVGQGIDENGNHRPVDLDNSLYPNAADGSDIGAWEAQALPDDAPVISPTTQTVSGTVGVAITSANQVQATDGDSDPLTYSVVSGTMPAGLTFNSNGTITGTPTAAGQTSVTFKANDGLEDSNTGTLNLNITEASSLVVNTDLDVVSAYDGLTSLREALIYEANNGLSTPITFDPTFFATPRTITLSSSLGPLTIYDGSATITGSAAGVTIDGGNAVQVFNFFCFDTQTVMLNQLTLAHGNGSSGGGAVEMQNIGGTAQNVELTGCTVSGNTAVQGAGIFNSGGGALTLINCTVAGNQATGSAGGGGIALLGNSTGSILDSTIALNSAPNASAGGVLVAAGCSLSLGNSIVASNTAASDPDLQGAVTSQGYNLIGNSTGATITGVTTGNLLNTSPGLDPAGLAGNGGPTQTIALANTSPALDQGKTMGGVTADQRGQARPFDLSSVSNASGGDGSDIGAFELILPLPTVTSINPAAGPLAGGTSVAIVGTNFTNASTVAFGGSAASSVTFNSATSLTAVAPAHAAGAVDVTVTDSGQTSVTGAADSFTYTAVPVVTSLSAAGGPLGGTTIITLTGSHFTGASAVNFGGIAASSFTVNSDSSITATAPAEVAGSVNVTVTTVGGTSASGFGNAYQYVPAPVITSISPTTGPLGGAASVVIIGSNLTGATNVNFGASAATSFTVNSDTSITAAAPAGTGTVDVTVTTAGGGSATGASDQFTYVAVPTVSGLGVAAGPLAGSTAVTITGTNFIGVSAVKFGAASATFTVNSATSISATSPAASAGIVDVVVTAAGGVSTATAADQYTYVGAPVFSSGGTATGVYNTAYAGSSLYTAVASNGPTYGLASGTLPPGLTLDPASGNLTGTPSQAGSFPVTLSATNAGGTVTLPLAITIGKAAATVILAGLTTTYTGAPLSPTATTNPIGLAVNFTYGSSAAAPTASGIYSVTGTINDLNYQGSMTGTFTIQKVSQSISFPAPVPAAVGAPVALSASASSGLPITYSVSGNATLSGSTVTPLDTNPVSITASQSGNFNYVAAPSVTRTITATAAALQSQTITVGTVPSNATSAKAFTLNSTASSGLPVTYTLTGGPATISGATVTPTGLAGTITIVISQAGNSTYSAAPSVTITVPVSAVGVRVFFGTFTVVTSSSVGAGIHPDAALTGTIAATINATSTSGTLLGTVGGSAFVATITIAADGTYTGATTAITAAGSTVSGPLTFAGTLSGNTLSGTIAELHASFSIPADSTTGVTSFIAGFYAASALDSASGSTYVVVGSLGELLVVTITPTGVSSAMGTVTAAGAFTVTIPPSVTVTGSINSATTSLTGTVTTPTGGTVAFSGLSGATAPTDRLVNLSSRGTVSGANQLVSGLVIGGSVSKTLLLRAIGPGLASFGVPGALAHPHLQLFDSTGKILSDTAAWGGSSSLMSAFSLTGAFPLVATSADAAVLMTLAPGQYTIQVSNAATDAGGAALAEIYDADSNPGAETQRLINISTRAFVSSSTTLTGGFVVTGNTPKTVLVRGIGPGLTGFGIANALTDPALTLFDGSGNIIAQNDNWGTPVAVTTTQIPAAAADINAADLATGAFTLTAGSKDAALIVTLLPGSYTAQVTGAAGASGTALVEIYEITSP